MKLLRTFAALGAALTLSWGAAAQYPTNNPGYIPTALFAPQTFSAAAVTAAPVSVLMTLQNTGTVTLNVSGTFTGLSATVQTSPERVGETGVSAPTYSPAAVEPVSGGGGLLRTITAAGVYRLNGVAGGSVRVLLSALSTGSVTVDAAVVSAQQFHSVSNVKRATYSSTFIALAPAASATDFINLKGNATTTVRLNRVECSGTATANAVDVLTLIKRSVANSGGTPTNSAGVPHDALDPAAVSIPVSYAANPTPGAAVGTFRAGLLSLANVTTPTLASPSLVWTFGDNFNEEVTLRGAAQSISLNNNGASFPSGTAITCQLTWSEE